VAFLAALADAMRKPKAWGALRSSTPTQTQPSLRATRPDNELIPVPIDAAGRMTTISGLIGSVAVAVLSTERHIDEPKRAHYIG
jgi:hypothetical protein